MAEFGLLGRSIKYSRSKKVHEAYGLYDYDFFEVEPEELEDFFVNRKWFGINITIPYKIDAKKYCDKLSSIADRIGAVNTVYEGRSGELIGDNTDYYGFLHTLNVVKAKTNGKKVLVLGRGGAAKCIRECMRDRHAGVVWQTSRGDLRDLSKMKDAEIIINATPLGTAMTEHEGKRPCDLTQFPKCELVIDLVYNPPVTPLLAQAKELGITCINGLEMNSFQAEKAAHRFMSTKNVVLIGMPGCGKSHIGRVLADKSGRTFYDTDAEVKKLTGKYASEIIKEKGEAYFRKLETKALEKLLDKRGAVIATGGGIVTQEINYKLIKEYKNPPLVIWIERDLDRLGTKNRPLSSNLEDLYNQRAELYERFADINVDNNSEPEACVREIKRMCKI